MRCYLISDNADTQMGMRIAGVEGVVVHKHDEVMDALKKAAAQDDIATVFITKKLVNFRPFGLSSSHSAIQKLMHVPKLRNRLPFFSGYAPTTTS